MINYSINDRIYPAADVHTSSEVEVMPDIMQENIEILNSFETLENDWDGYGALAPGKAIINVCRSLIERLNRQPEIFPTPDGGIQLEYATGKNRHLNIELLSENRINIFEMFSDRTSTEEILDLDFDTIKRRIDKFYVTI